VFEWAKASRFFKKQSAVGRYLFLSPSWDENGAQFGCRFVVPKGPEAHGCTIGTFSRPPRVIGGRLGEGWFLARRRGGFCGSRYISDP
jgi:hypothetical protein